MSKQTMFDFLCSERTLLHAWKYIRSKGSSGGIDGQSIEDFELNLESNLEEIIDEVSTGKWHPMPYLQVTIPKKKNEKRKLGLLTIKDKIIQQAIRSLIEPKIDNIFVGNSYGYRPGKGAVKAIRRAIQEKGNKQKEWVLRLDIDNYFDNINHEILQSRIKSIISDPELVRLIMLCMKMGVVSKGNKWQDIEKGVPQGAVLSPLLANLYLHSFDQFVLSRTNSYVRYADDFIILCDSEPEAIKLQTEATEYLNDKLKLSLNSPSITKINDGFEFLGITIDKEGHRISDKKREDIHNSIKSFTFSPFGLDKLSNKKWDGLKAYYAELLDEGDLKKMDELLYLKLRDILQSEWKNFQNRTILSKALWKIEFLSTEYRLKSKEIRKSLIDIYLDSKSISEINEFDRQNESIVNRRKREYQKLEVENSELIVTTPGSIVSYNSQGITVKKKGLILFKVPVSNVKHISIMSDGVLLTTNLLAHTLKNKIPIDIFGERGKHIGSFINSQFY